jgi:hypothetical protein
MERRRRLRIPPADKPLAAVLPSEPAYLPLSLGLPVAGPQEALHDALAAPYAALQPPLPALSPDKGPTPYPHVKEEP